MSEQILKQFDSNRIKNWEAAKNAVWEAIPGRKYDLSQKGYLERAGQWAMRYELMRSCPEWVREISFIIYEASGIEPNGSAKEWIRQISDLWEASGQNTEILIKGIKEIDSKRKGGRRPKNPRYYLSYVKNQRSLWNKRSK